jgi:hypothetical protein
MTGRNLVRPSLTACTVSAASLTVAALTSLVSPAHAGVRPEVDVYDTTVNESVVAPNALLTVRLDRKAASKVTVTWKTVDGTAKAGRDYVSKKGKVVFEKGQRAKKIRIPISDDDRAESTELFYVTFASKKARVTRKRTAVTIIDDDVATYDGQIVVTSRSEGEANGFYTLESWTLTFRPRLVPVFQGTAWYDDGFGTYELTGSRIVEDHRPGAGCRVMEKETWSGEGDFFTEPHPDTDVRVGMGNLVMQSFFPQHAGNLGLDPLLHVMVEASADGTQYTFEDGACVPSAYELTRRFGLEEDVPGEVESDGRGRLVVFDHHLAEDNSSSEEIDTHELDVVGELTVMKERARG